MVTPLDKLHALSRLLDENQPPPADLYVPAGREVANQIVDEILAATGDFQKHLLFGARGAGKSTQMREIARGLAKDCTLIEIDLDASRIGTPELTAFDLVYVIALAALREVPEKQQDVLFDRLTSAYGRESKSRLGKLKDALAGIVGFGTATTAAAKALALAAGPVGIVTGGVAMVATGITLLSRPEAVMSARSPDGRAIHDAAAAIIAAAQPGKPALVVLLDGLEKVNGRAAQWLRETFERTLLVLELPVTIVLATPPCTFYETNAVDSLGYIPHSVWGFAPDESIRLQTILRCRIEAAELDPHRHGFAEACVRTVEASGGHPRFAVRLLKRIVSRMIRAKRPEVLPEDIDDAIRDLREFLVGGLSSESYAVLDGVDLSHQLGKDSESAGLFRDGRILAHPPAEDGTREFHVHPLLEAALARHRRDRAAREAEKSKVDA